MQRFRDRLQSEFDARREKNARYSMRAFAKLLGTEHATVSQILRGTRRVPLARIRAWAKRLGIPHRREAWVLVAEKPRRANTGDMGAE